nr:MAG: hypothetical protein DIU56_17305 [Pseudomonadota bacterium]
MATRRYKISPGALTVTEEAGDPVDSDVIELTVELANTAVHDGAGTRTVSKLEVLESLERLKKHIIESPWPPA